MNKAYVRPTLQVQGKLEAMTQGSSKGSRLDNAFPSGTPFGDLTFS
ncbi:putative RiPP precursor [Paracoccus indicus]|nr:putative RiPP precursor [Paracoccus indicus]